MTDWSAADHTYMSRAVSIAWQGLYTTEPNPRVGCVLVKDGKLIAEGYHRKAGEGHAEVNALRNAAGQAKGCTAYVTLEPCSHFGKTPPCAEALINADVAEVVVGMVDPNPRVSGNGLKKLQQAGIKVRCGLMEAQCRQLNPGFIKRMATGIPLVRLKMAASLDGRTAMASGESQWITGPLARQDVQRLRARSSAVVSGVASIISDDASLTVRAAELGLEHAAEVARRQPLRVVLDSSARLPEQAKLLGLPGRTLIVSCVDAPDFIAAYDAVEWLKLPAINGAIDLPKLLQELAHRECNEVLVETGATLAGAFMAQGLVDELVLYQAMTLLGSNARPMFLLPLDKMSQQKPLKLIDSRVLGDDLRLTLIPRQEK
ncbi:bifunctional diaminohydroxyphosphoribosylaminopyrimidine deaminase/5-amino-6-(5-phosphoribosylamino)uracil reductase RibD [Amphritea sp. 1_MG-2023]|uniref:bifunctional diaminohydroxyphosphoribosylaminopyrimidine deaminase/5-amino-6-(5-phosphoribosylamino)uracil reductase RibD n=1 Tax=Amphritea sp. 1_MG-2023 TaxID=3062670 RepID=UPI0026E24368|nr:bifunctional diaminohydroxyphosphoribosylaminopyrimidine deaminase/5-amino-6-(5-phosphoribosylamino)uracil reductase RibD [Amphritea sp. 1_MG-2023]MDO6563053.1 bifunctional diaminohydroxyphosphoribosylaminopyrimidine deaminase/5-amino-6-(5-phosphoribosylamino)uracil reductase RibD [Amphritea sp. 1_MG-2023]